MSKRCRILTAFAAVSLFVASHGVADDIPDEVQAKELTLSMIRKAPDSFRNVTVEFEVTFHEFAQVFNPYFTRFVPETFVNFAAWGSEQNIWKLKEYKNDFSYLFIRKGNKELANFMKMRRFDRVQLMGVVRDSFKGEPWIEVVKIKYLQGKLTEKALIHRVRGDMAMKRKRPAIAVREYERCLKEKKLPQTFTKDVALQLGLAHYQSRDFKSARDVFVKLLQTDKKNKHLAILAQQSAARINERSTRELYAKNRASRSVVPVPIPDSTPPMRIEPLPVQPVEPQPIEPQPMEPSPAEPMNIEPMPIQPADPQPAQPQPMEPTPVEPTEPQPAEPMPVDPSPAQPTEPQPTEPTPAEPTEPQPMEPAPTEPTPAEPTEPTPSEPTPAEPTEPTPSEPTPAEPTEPTPSEPTPAEPTEPTPSEPTPAEPTEPTPSEPTPAEPTEPTPAEPTEPEPLPNNPNEPGGN